MHRPFKNKKLREIIKRKKSIQILQLKNFIFTNFLHATTKIVPATAI